MADLGSNSAPSYSLTTRDNFYKGLQKEYGKFNDPTYLGFVFLFDYDSPLLNTDEGKIGTAANYLSRIGDQKRLKYLKNFIKQLKYINKNMTWYWQSIEGLNTAWDTKDFKDPFRGGDESLISVTCLESIDMRITMLMDLYRHATYDFEFMREIIPSNLREFKTYVYIQEMRRIQTRGGLIGNAAANVLNLDSRFADTNKFIGDNMPRLFFKLHYCEFIPDVSNEMMGNLSYAAPEQAGQKISFHYKKVTYPGNKYTFNDILVGSQPEKNKKADQDFTLPNLGDKASAVFEKKKGDVVNSVDQSIQNMTGNVEGLIENTASAAVSKLVLGNVNNVSVTTLDTALQQATVQSLGNIFGPPSTPEDNQQAT